MLRVTEEKERNFEKRGYMGKKVLGIMVILLFFTGCQNMGNVRKFAAGRKTGKWRRTE